MKPCRNCEERREALRQALAAMSSGDVEEMNKKFREFSDSLVASGREMANTYTARMMENLRAKNGAKK